MGFKCWNGFYEQDNEVFVDKSDYIKMLESDNPVVQEIARNALDALTQKNENRN